jgi:hypothetical protein
VVRARPRDAAVTLPFDLQPWMLWTVFGLAGGAVLGLVGGVWRARRRPIANKSELTFLPLRGAGASAQPARSARPLAIVPPAPLAAAAPLSGEEQRTEFRRPGNPVLILVADADNEQTPWNAWVVDRSRRGVRLAVERPLVLGQVYTVRPLQAPPATPWSAIEVRHCAPIDGHWEVGCRFLAPLSVAVLMYYG